MWLLFRMPIFWSYKCIYQKQIWLECEWSLLCFLHEGLQHSCFQAAQMKTNGHNNYYKKKKNLERISIKWHNDWTFPCR